jgi:SAM-dependent methyltransferase
MLLPPAELPEFFGQIDIYLFDQLLKGRFTPGMRLLDAGSGTGRNLPYFLRHGFDVCAVDAAPGALDGVRQLAADLAPRLPATNFRVESLESLSFPDADFDAVIASAVLHFARDEAHFRAMVAELWRVLRPGGLSSRGSRPRWASSRASCPWAAAATTCPTAATGSSSTRPCSTASRRHSAARRSSRSRP